jgi:DNA-binding NtrC family response regulator
MPTLKSEYPEEPSTVGVGDKLSGAGLTLRVVAEGFSASHRLPTAGDVILGRSSSADIRIDDASISRHHAQLSLGERVLLEDLGSANGTRVGGRALAARKPIELQVGEPVELGSVLVVLQAGAVAARPRRLWTHDYFEGRLEDECARSVRARSRFAVVRLHVEGVPDEAGEEALSSGLRASDLIARYARGEYELLLVDADRATAERVAQAGTKRLMAIGGAVRVGVAVYPADGTTPEALMLHACREATGRLPGSRSAGAAPTTVVVENEAMRRLHRLVDRVTGGSISVLLLGETGVGKEVIAEQLHRRSPRRDKPFLRLNCAALPETLLESELFGYQRGAYSGAARDKPGLFEAADGGTVFLDEVGELTAALQVKLLRVLEDKTVMRLGALKSRTVDIRFVAATNRDLEAAVARGTFRQDLYFRLNGIALLIPPLRERKEEIVPLARMFLARTAEELGRVEPELTDEAVTALTAYAYPGNVRELRNMMERAIMLSEGGPIAATHLPLGKMKVTLAPSGTSAPDVDGGGEADVPMNDASFTEEHEAERQRIIEALNRSAGNQTQAARLLGIARTTLVLRLEAYRIPRPRKKPILGP